jgi:hypothetical protein
MEERIMDAERYGLPIDDDLIDEDRQEDARIEEAQERYERREQRRIWRQMERERRG